MLGKLLKYETKATVRLFAPLYAALLLFALVNRFLNPFKIIETTSNSVNITASSIQQILSMLSIFLYFALIVAVIAMTFIIMLQRFYKNLLGDEGYLMFTLPVKPWQHILSKLLVSMLWVITSFIVIVGSVLLVMNVDNLFGELGELFNLARDFIGVSGLILIPITALVASAYSILVIYNSLSIGHTFTKNKVLASFAAYVVIYVVTQVISSIFLLLSAKKLLIPLVQSTELMPSQVKTLVAFAMGLNLLLAIGHFIIANIVLNKKLNLE